MDSDFSYVSYFHVIFIFSVMLSVYSVQLSSTILFKAYCSVDVEFDCNFCDSKNKIPRPKAKVQLNIIDDTGFLSITVDDRHAETLLGFTGLEIYERYLKRINEELQRQTLLSEVRSYWPPQRQYMPLYFLTAFILEESAAEETVSDTNVTEIPASSTSLLAEMSSSVKRNLEPDFSQVTKHQKLD
ncbi:uncharacterized protein [Coffea arabica]|uniref:Uncharacterized protein isoform X4 n=1 Tax=Coffea arabica TaxID=13443 RepID=A0ABM4VKL8_COFAR